MWGNFSLNLRFYTEPLIMDAPIRYDSETHEKEYFLYGADKDDQKMMIFANLKHENTNKNSGKT
jgi:hypothetical protein